MSQIKLKDLLLETVGFVSRNPWIKEEDDTPSINIKELVNSIQSYSSLGEQIYGKGTGGSAVAGSVNTGGGAGGGGFQCGVGQAGGSGVVILRMLTSDYTGTTSGSPTVTTSGSDTILTFNGNGSYTA